MFKIGFLKSLPTITSFVLFFPQYFIRIKKWCKSEPIRKILGFMFGVHNDLKRTAFDWLMGYDLVRTSGQLALFVVAHI